MSSVKNTLMKKAGILILSLFEGVVLSLFLSYFVYIGLTILNPSPPVGSGPGPNYGYGYSIAFSTLLVAVIVSFITMIVFTVLGLLRISGTGAIPSRFSRFDLFLFLIFSVLLLILILL